MAKLRESFGPESDPNARRRARDEARSRLNARLVNEGRDHESRYVSTYGSEYSFDYRFLLDGEVAVANWQSHTTTPVGTAALLARPGDSVPVTERRDDHRIPLDPDNPVSFDILTSKNTNYVNLEFRGGENRFRLPLFLNELFPRPHDPDPIYAARLLAYVLVFTGSDSSGIVGR